MHPILFYVGSTPIGAYGGALAAAFVAGITLGCVQGRLDGIDLHVLFRAIVLGTAAAIAGGKIEMLIVDALRTGGGFGLAAGAASGRAGGAEHGAVVLGFAMIALLHRIHGRALPLRAAADAIAPGVAIAQAVARVGCFGSGCCYGTPTDAPWGVTFTSDVAHATTGVPLHQRLHPVQLYMLAMHVAIVIVLLVARRHRRVPGEIFVFYLLLEGLGRIVVETWRGDADRGAVHLAFATVSTGDLTGAAFLVAGVALLVWVRRRPVEAERADLHPAKSA